MSKPDVAAENQTSADDPVEDESGSSDSYCLLLLPDTADADSKELVSRVLFKRDERGDGSIDDAAADLLGVRGDRVRCCSLPGGFEKKLGLSLHMYIDLQGMQHGLPHNTNATQLWLIAHLPEEPPEVQPSSIHGPVLLSAEDFKTEEYANIDKELWGKIKAICRAIQPNAQFLPYEPPSAEDATRDLGDD